MAVGTLTLQRFNGDEAFAVATATALAMLEEDQVALNLDIETDEQPLKTLPDTLPLAAQPNAEVTIRLPKAEWLHSSDGDFRFRVLGTTRRGTTFHGFTTLNTRRSMTT
jgi:hypothetical protein